MADDYGDKNVRAYLDDQLISGHLPFRSLDNRIVKPSNTAGDILTTETATDGAEYSQWLSARDAVDVGTYSASMFLANSGAPTHTSSGGWQKVADGGGTDTWTSQWDIRPTGASAQVDTATNKRIDIQKTGLYLCSAAVFFSAISDARVTTAGIYVNGTLAMHGAVHNGVAGGVMPKVTEPLSLTAGDYLELWAFQNDSASEAYNTSAGYHNRLTATYIGRSS